MDWYLKVLRNYIGFGGRARRKEYWMFVLVNVIFTLVLGVVDKMLGWQRAGGEGILTTIYGVLVFLPWWAPPGGSASRAGWRRTRLIRPAADLVGGRPATTVSGRIRNVFLDPGQAQCGVCRPDKRSAIRLFGAYRRMAA